MCVLAENVDRVGEPSDAPIADEEGETARFARESVIAKRPGRSSCALAFLPFDGLTCRWSLSTTDVVAVVALDVLVDGRGLFISIAVTTSGAGPGPTCTRLLSFWRKDLGGFDVVGVASISAARNVPELALLRAVCSSTASPSRKGSGIGDLLRIFGLLRAVLENVWSSSCTSFCRAGTPL